MIAAFGSHPSDSKGESFSLDAESWDPLREYCESVHGDIMADIKVDDDGVSIVDRIIAAMLAVRLQVDCESGAAQEYVTARKLLLQATPSTACELCHGTGVRTDETGQDMLMDTLELPLDSVLRLGRTHGWCDGCNGEGVRQRWERSCRLEVEDIRRFADFLGASGGCLIY